MPAPLIPTLPTPPNRNNPANFSTQADAFLGALPDYGTAMNALSDYMDNLAMEAETDANTASEAAAEALGAAAAAAMEAVVWVASAAYTQGFVVYSPVDFNTYRAKTTHSGVATDPSADTTNWAPLGGVQTLGGFGVTATAAELNYNDITTLGVSQASKVVTANGSGNVTLSGDVTFGGAIVEDVFALSGTTPALDPSNGTIQTWTLSGNSTPTDSFSAGESVTMLIDDGSAFSITWPTVTWLVPGGLAPTLATTGYTAVVLFKVGATLYGKY